jgi:hypothetical protein
MHAVFLVKSGVTKGVICFDQWIREKNVLKFRKNSALVCYSQHLQLEFWPNYSKKFECPPIMKNVFPEITKNFYIGRF